MAKNPFGKSRPTNLPYAIYTARGGFDMTWHVLKSYQMVHREGANSRWFVAAKSDATYGSFELGDTYAIEVKRHGVLVAADPEWLDAYDIASTVPTPADYLAR
tara:strand:- start:231 stop:539 length:309 start_codon:yes stop_codon:yes gene_type:complete